MKISRFRNVTQFSSKLTLSFQGRWHIDIQFRPDDFFFVVHFLYYWQNIITCGFLSLFQANKGVCGFWGEIVHITWKTWPCAHCAVVEVWHRATWVSWNMWNISMLSRPSFFSSLAPIFLMFLSGEVSWMCQSGDFQVNLIFESDKATIFAKSHTWQGFCFDQGLLRWQPFLWQCDLSKRGLC